MIDVDALLNPAFQNPELRAYAYLSAQFKSGVRSPLDCLRPFVVYALSEFSGHQLNWQAIRDKLYARYRLNIPFYMLERMQEPLARMGALTASDIPRVYLCADARPAVSHKSVDFSISDIDEAARALAHFAAARGVSKPLTADTWSDVLVPFFLSKSPPKDKATATVRGVIISDPKAFDFSHVAEFIVEQQRTRSPIYKTLEKIYYGALVSDFLTQFERNGDKAAFKGLSIYYDGPVILRLLGLSGRVLEGATLELHDVLKELGCRICFFSHTYDEVSDSIEAILKCYENGQPIFKDTQEAISRGELKIADVYKAKSDLDLILSANLGLIEQTGGYDNRESDSFQIDEDAFKAYLSRNKTWGREYSLAADRDARSLALILRLRNGKVARDVTKSGYVFITHNVRLTILAKEFLKSERQLSEGSIWPFMTVGQMATIAWVANEAFGSEGRASKELIANCYSASLPDEDFDSRLKDVLTATVPDQVHDLYKNAFVVQSIRQVALTQTAGFSSLIRTLKTSELLAEAAQVRQQAIDKARTEERALAQSELSENLKARQLEIARKASGQVARIILAVITLVSVAFILRDYGLLGAAQKDRSHLAAIILAGVTIYGALDVFGVLPAASVREKLRGAIFLGITRVQTAIT